MESFKCFALQTLLRFAKFRTWLLVQYVDKLSDEEVGLEGLELEMEVGKLHEAA